MERHGLIWSTGAKGRSPDNAAAEGFFGRMKTESVHPWHWEERPRGETLVPVGDCILWHDHGRIKRLDDEPGTRNRSEPGNGCVIISKKTSAAPTITSEECLLFSCAFGR